MSTNLVKIEYVDSKTDVVHSEIVSPSSPRFMEIIRHSETFTKIEEAPEGSIEGSVGNYRTLSFRENGEYVQVNIAFTVTNEGILKIDDSFETFKVRGFEVSKTYNEKYGDILSVDLKQSTFALVDREIANDFAYAIRTIQQLNDAILDAVSENEEPVISGMGITKAENDLDKTDKDSYSAKATRTTSEIFNSNNQK